MSKNTFKMNLFYILHVAVYRSNHTLSWMLLSPPFSDPIAREMVLMTLM